MSLLWRKTLSHFSAHRLCALITLSAYLVVAIGLPLPALARKQSGQPFPCQHHLCGCASAEQCWEHCCCFTPEEKLTWAEANGIQPPAYAQRPAAEGWSSPRLRDQEPGCLADASAPCASQSAPRKSACVHCRLADNENGRQNQRKCCRSSTDEGTTTTSQEKKAYRWTPGVAGLHCRGLSTTWVYAGAVPPPHPETHGKPFLPFVARITYLQVSCNPNAPVPPDPPPRAPHA
jgi:hypothetical protein